MSWLFGNVFGVFLPIHSKSVCGFYTVTFLLAWNYTANVRLATTMQSQQQIQILGYHISVDAAIRDKIFNTKNNEFFNWKKIRVVEKKIYRKRKPPTTFLCCWWLYVAGRGCSVWFYGRFEQFVNIPVKQVSWSEKKCSFLYPVAI